MRDYVLTAIIFGLVPVCFFRPWVGVLAWYWLGIMNPHRQTWDFAYTMPFAAMIGGATLAGALLARDRRPIPWNRELVLIVLLLLYFTFTNFFAWVPDFAWLQWKKVVKVVLMTLFATMLIYGKDRIRMLLLTVVFSLGFYGVKGFLFVLRSGGGDMVQGPDSTFIDGNTNIGLAFNMVVPLMIFMAREETKPWLKRTLYIMAACTIISTIFTYSRGAYVGLLVILPFVFLRAQKKVLAAMILIPAVLIGPLLLPDKVFQRADKIENYQEDMSAIQRLQSWTVAWNIATESPLTGAGFDFEYAHPSKWFSYTSEKYMWAFRGITKVAHSVYFQVLGQHGFIAFFLFMALLFSSLLTLRRLKKHVWGKPDAAWIGTYANGIQVALIGFMVSGAFLSAAYFDLAWLFFALTAVLANEVRLMAKDEARSTKAAGAMHGRAAPGTEGVLLPRPGQATLKT